MALLAGPMVVIPATAGAGAATAAAGESLRGMTGSTAVRYARTVATFLLPAAGSSRATAASADKQQPSATSSSDLKQSQDFVYWPD